MGASMRPERPGLTLANGRNVNDLPPAEMWDALVQHGIQPDEATRQVAAIHGAPPAPVAQESPEPIERTGVLARGVSGALSGLGHLVAHPIDTIEQAATSYVSAPFTAAIAPSVGQSRVSSSDAAVPQSDGMVAIRNNRTGIVTRVPANATTYDAEHGGVTGKERGAAFAQTAANVLLPRLLAGAGAATKSLPTAQRILARTATASAGGAVAGAAYSPNDPGGGAVAGAFLAPVVEAGGRGVARALPKPAATNTIGAGAVRALGGQTVQDAAYGDLLKQLGRSRMTLEDFSAAARTALPSETAIDIGGDAMTSRAGGAVATPSRGSVDIRNVLTARNTEQPRRVLSNLAETMGVGPRENVVQSIEQQAKDRAESSSQWYDVLRSHYDQAPKRITALDQQLGKPSFEDAIRETESILKERDPNGFAPLVETAQNGTRRVRPLTFTEADLLKRAMDDVTDVAKVPNPIASGGVTKTRRGAMTSTGASVTDALDEAFKGNAKAGVPSYAEVRGQHADASQLIDAHADGVNFLKTPGDQLKADFAKLSPAQREFYRRGALASLEDYLARTTDGNDITIKLRNPLIRDKLRTIFPDAQTAGQFEDLIRREGLMRGRSNSILANSKTAERLAQQSDAAGPGVGEALSAATGNPVPLLKYGIGAAMKQRAAGLTERQVDALAPLLTAQGPDQIAALARSLREYQARRATRPTIGSPRVAGQLAGAGTRP